MVIVNHFEKAVLIDGCCLYMVLLIVVRKCIRFSYFLKIKWSFQKMIFFLCVAGRRYKHTQNVFSMVHGYDREQRSLIGKANIL